MPSSPVVLPPELQLEVFEIAAVCAAETIPNLRLVSKNVNHLMMRMWYRVVRLDPNYNHPPIHSAPDEDQSFDLLDRYGHHTRHLLIQNKSPEYVAEVLKRCPHVEELVLWVVLGNCDCFIPLMLALPLKCLSFDPRRIFKTETSWPGTGYIPRCFSELKHLTRLDIVNALSVRPQDEVKEAWSTLSLIPSLKYVSSHYEHAYGFGAFLRSAFPQFAYILQLCRHPPEGEHEPGVIRVTICYDLIDEWELAARKGLYGGGAWAKADAIYAGGKFDR